MIIRIKIYLVVLLSLIFFSQNIYSQINQPQSNKFKMEFSVFISTCIQTQSEMTNIFGILGDVFIKSGSSQNFRFNDDFLFTGNILTDSKDIHNLSIPDRYELQQNYPNPFNPSTKIEYAIPEEGFVNLTVYNLIGQVVEEIVNEYKRAGYYDVTFNANNLSSGFYIYRITSGKFNTTKKMLLIK
jgi:hypothetical protein